MPMPKMYSIEPVACKRAGDTFDAELVFKQETYSRDGSEVKYNPRLLKSGFKTREEAEAYAKEIVDGLQKKLEDHVDTLLNQWKEAKP